MRVSLLAAVDFAHVATGLGDNPTAVTRPSTPRSGAAWALLQVVASQRARYRRRLSPRARAAAILLPLLQVPRRSTRTLLTVNRTVTILSPRLKRSAVHLTRTACMTTFAHLMFIFLFYRSSRSIFLRKFIMGHGSIYFIFIGITPVVPLDPRPTRRIGCNVASLL